MSIESSTEYIRLSKLIQKLKDQEYYRTYAKSLLMTNRPEIKAPEDDLLIEEMFLFFIQNEDLKIYTDSLGSFSQYDDINNLKFISDHKDELFVEPKELKKLYANKCIVLSNALIKECAEESK